MSSKELFRPKISLPQIDKEKSLLPVPRIFVGNDAIAFFDVNNPDKKPISIAEVKGKPTKELHGQQYNHLVQKDETHYFRTDDYGDHLQTVSVASTCVVICAYTTGETGRVKSSGVYHSIMSSSLEDRLYKLIDSVRPEPTESVIVKAAGGSPLKVVINGIDCSKKYTQRDSLPYLLAKRGVTIKPEHILLGGFMRIVEFYPRSGQLITYFANSEQKNVL